MLKSGVNWCSPYKDWKAFYMSDPITILQKHHVNITDDIRKSVLGQEAAMWSEQVRNLTIISSKEIYLHFDSINFKETSGERHFIQKMKKYSKFIQMVLRSLKINYN